MCKMEEEKLKEKKLSVKRTEKTIEICCLYYYY